MASNDQQQSGAPMPAASAVATPATLGQPFSNPANIITALGNAFKNQNRESITGERIAQLLAQNMSQLGDLARQGKLNARQIQQVRVQWPCHVPFLSPRTSRVGKGTPRNVSAGYVFLGTVD